MTPLDARINGLEPARETQPLRLASARLAQRLERVAALSVIYDAQRPAVFDYMVKQFYGEDHAILDALIGLECFARAQQIVNGMVR